MAVANLDDPSALSHLIAGALRIGSEERQALLEEVDVGKRLRRLSEILARELDIVAIGSKIQSQVNAEMEKGQREWVLRQQLKAIQDELGEQDPAEAEVDELRSTLAELDLPERGPHPGRPRARPAGEDPAGGRRARRHPHLPRVDGLAAVGQGDRRQARPRARARGARRRPLRHREGQGPHPRVPRRAASSSRTRAARSCASPARPGVGKTSLGPVGRARARPQVRAHQRRRRARRVRDPRPPPHLHRRDAGHDHPRAARRRVVQPGVHDRRDRQDGRRLPRRPRQRDARGARPRAERHVPRPLPRRAVRPQPRDVHLHGERHGPRARRRCATAWRSSRSPATPRRRSSRSPSATWCRARSSATGSRSRRSASRDTGIREIITSYTREAGVRSLEREIGSACRKVALEVALGHARAQDVGDRAARARAARPPALPARRPPPDRRAGRRHRARVDAGRRRRPVRGGERDAGQGPADDHRPARRRDARVGRGGALVRPRPRGHARGLVRQARRPRARARGRDPQGRPERGRHDGDRADVAGLRPPGPRRRRDDRRADADGPGAADRRAQGEGARGPAGRASSGCSRRAATRPTSRTSPSRCARTWTSSGWARSARCSPPRCPMAPSAVDCSASRVCSSPNRRGEVVWQRPRRTPRRRKPRP